MNIPQPVIAATIQLHAAIGAWLATLPTAAVPPPIQAPAQAAPAVTGVQVARHPSSYNLAKYNYTKFDPTWKYKTRLTEKGIEGICYAIMSGIDISTIANIFKVNQGAPYAYVRRIAGEIPWGRNKIPSWL